MMSTAILVSYFVPSNTWQMANTWLLEKKAVHAMLCISLICLMPRGNDRCIHGYGAPYVSCYPIWAVTQFELLLWAFWPSVPQQVQKLNWCIGSFWSSCCLSERALSSSRAYSIRIFAFLVHLCQGMCCHNSRQPAWQSDIEIATSFPLHDCNDSLCLTTCCIWHNVSVI